MTENIFQYIHIFSDIKIEILSFAITRIDCEGTVLTEQSQTMINAV